MLKFEDGNSVKEKQKEIEKRLKYFRHEEWAKPVFLEYQQYLLKRGDKERGEKIERLLDFDSCQKLR